MLPIPLTGLFFSMLLDNINRLESGDGTDDSDTDNYSSDFSVTDDEIESNKIFFFYSSLCPNLSFFNNLDFASLKQPVKTLKKLSKPNHSSSINSNVNSSLNRLAEPNIIHTTITSSHPKKSKNSRVVTRTRRVQPIERDDNGQPILPQQIGVLTVLSLGEIVNDRPNFHNERYIFPVGYSVSR